MIDEGVIRFILLSWEQLVGFSISDYDVEYIGLELPGYLSPKHYIWKCIGVFIIMAIILFIMNQSFIREIYHVNKEKAITAVIIAAIMTLTLIGVVQGVF